MKSSKLWSVRDGIDFDQFSSGEKMLFVRAVSDSTSVEGGFRFEVTGLVDESGKFHVLDSALNPEEPRHD